MLVDGKLVNCIWARVHYKGSFSKLFELQKLENIHQRVEQAVKYVNNTYNDVMTFQVGTAHHPYYFNEISSSQIYR